MAQQNCSTEKKKNDPMTIKDAVRLVKNHIGPHPENPRLEEALDVLETANIDLLDAQARAKALRSTVDELIEQNKMLSKPF